MVHPKLHNLMGLKEGEEAHHDVEATMSRDPVTLVQCITVSQTDVTDAVLAQRQLLLAHAELAEEKVRGAAECTPHRSLLAQSRAFS